MISHIWCSVPRFASVDPVRTQSRAVRELPCRSLLLRLYNNTVYFRLNRIRELTGIDRADSALLLLTTARMLNAGRGGAAKVSQG